MDHQRRNNVLINERKKKGGMIPVLMQRTWLRPSGFSSDFQSEDKTMAPCECYKYF